MSVHAAAAAEAVQGTAQGLGLHVGVLAVAVPVAGDGQPAPPPQAEAEVQAEAALEADRADRAEAATRTRGGADGSLGLASRVLVNTHGGRCAGGERGVSLGRGRTLDWRVVVPMAGLALASPNRPRSPPPLSTRVLHQRPTFSGGTLAAARHCSHPPALRRHPCCQPRRRRGRERGRPRSSGKAT